uniref:Secreted protein n=1 Tax=Canis lupus familiaris TaxID=9615 RepID=A0A8C0QBM5_CANLF
MLILPLFVLAWGYLHHAVLRLDRQLLGGEVVDVQGHAPAVGRLPDLRHAAAELPAERAAVGGRGGRGGALDRGGDRAHVARPAAVAEPLRPLLRQPGQPEGLVEEAAVGRVPVAERVPAGAPQEREGHSALGHGWGRRKENVYVSLLQGQ